MQVHLENLMDIDKKWAHAAEQRPYASRATMGGKGAKKAATDAAEG